VERSDRRGVAAPTEPHRFPLLDDELPPRPWWRRLLIPATVLVAAAAAAAVAATLVVSGRHPGVPAPAPARKIAVPGHIVSVNNNQDLVISAAGGTQVKSPSSLDQVGQLVTATLDGKYVSLGDGQLVSTKGSQIAMARTAIAPLVGGDQATFGSEPLADHNQELLAMAENPTNAFNRNRFYELSLKTSKRRNLGLADQASGDPRSPGAFVTIGAKAKSLVAANAPVLPDTMAELVVPGRPPVRYGSAAALAHDLGMKSKTGFTLDVYPSPSGDRVAITVREAAEDQDSTGIAVMSRAGHLVSKLPPSADPQGGAPVWSPDGTTLAFQGPAGVHVTVNLWTPGHAVRALVTPLSGGLVTGFGVLWSPDGQRLLVACTLGENPNSAARHWAIGKVTGGPMAQVTGPGTPVVWLP
jgi:hypothetical protein